MSQATDFMMEEILPSLDTYDLKQKTFEVHMIMKYVQTEMFLFRSILLKES